MDNDPEPRKWYSWPELPPETTNALSGRLRELVANAASSAFTVLSENHSAGSVGICFDGNLASQAIEIPASLFKLAKELPPKA